MSLENRKIAWVGPIQKGVPMPVSKRGMNLLKPRMAKLEVGDCFDTTYTNTAIHRVAALISIKCETRQMEVGKLRVWRTA